MLLWSYFSVVVTDPGGVPTGWRPELDVEKSDGNQALIGEANSSLSVGDSSSHGVRYCRKCNQYKPPRSHHCSVCKSLLFVILFFESGGVSFFLVVKKFSSWGFQVEDAY